jgi:hypothetical protein
MSKLEFKIDNISQLALEVMQAILAREAEAQTIMGKGSTPIDLAAALSDFFQIAGAVESGAGYMEADELSEFGAYGLDLLDRQDFLVRKLEIMDHREHLARIFPSLALWLARQGAVIDNLTGAADGFGMLVNGMSDTEELAEACRIMDEVIEAASETLQLDEDKSDTWRPWRVINLNAGIAATRSLDHELIETTFQKMGRRLPYDMPGFLADGKRQMIGQNVPDEVTDVVNRFAEKWTDKPPH